MTRLIASILSLTLGLGAAFALVSCGSSDKGLLPGDTADEIEKNLDLVQSQAAAGDCADAQTSADAVAQQVDDLGTDVNRRLRQALSEGAAHVQDVVATCTTAVTSESTATETETVDTEPVTTDTEPTETTTSEPIKTEPTTTEPTTTEPTTTEPTTSTPPPPPPPGGGGDVGQGGGNSGGGSGGIGPGGKSGLDG